MSDLDYDLPSGAIAQHPADPRDSARLLVDRTTDVEHRHVRDLPELLAPGDLLVVNDTRVIPARLHLWRSSGGAVEVLLLERQQHDMWEALVKPSRKLRIGEVVSADGLAVEIGPVTDDGTRLVRVLADDPMAALASHGEVPLPPYITAPLADPERYQTIYARQPGSAAAPTAGLHLTEQVLAQLHHNGIEMARVELVVGLDTFRPVTVEDTDDHVMHTESFTVAPDVLERCRAARRVVAVGTTSVRALESAAAGRSGRTDLFISRPYEWRVVDVMMTNFHMPRTTLLCMIDAFVGPRWRDLYATGLTEGYRFLSFGDAMLLTRAA